MQPPEAALLQTERISEPLTEAEQEEAWEMSMYVEMFSRADSEQSKVSATKVTVPHTGQAAPAGQTTQTEPEHAHDSGRTPPNDGADDIEVQQQTLQTVLNSLKEQLEARQVADQDRGKGKAVALEKIDLEQVALHIMIRAAENGTTLDSKVQIQVDTIQARKKL